MSYECGCFVWRSLFGEDRLVARLSPTTQLSPTRGCRTTPRLPLSPGPGGCPSSCRGAPRRRTAAWTDRPGAARSGPAMHMTRTGRRAISQTGMDDENWPQSDDMTRSGLLTECRCPCVKSSSHPERVAELCDRSRSHLHSSVSYHICFYRCCFHPIGAHTQVPGPG